MSANAADSEALEQRVSELLYEHRDYTWQIQARKVIELIRTESRVQAFEDAAKALMDVNEHESRMPGIRFAGGFLDGLKTAERGNS